MLSADEWRSLPKPVSSGIIGGILTKFAHQFKRPYCVLTKSRGRHVPKLEREVLEHRSGKSPHSVLSEDNDAFKENNLSVADIQNAYDEGNFVVPCIKLECKGFDWELYNSLTPMATGLSDNRSSARKGRGRGATSSGSGVDGSHLLDAGEPDTKRLKL